MRSLLSFFLVLTGVLNDVQAVYTYQANLNVSTLSFNLVKDFSQVHKVYVNYQLANTGELPQLVSHAVLEPRSEGYDVTDVTTNMFYLTTAEDSDVASNSMNYPLYSSASPGPFKNYDFKGPPPDNPFPSNACQNRFDFLNPSMNSTIVLAIVITQTQGYNAIPSTSNIVVLLNQYYSKVLPLTLPQIDPNSMYSSGVYSFDITKAPFNDPSATPLANVAIYENLNNVYNCGENFVSAMQGAIPFNFDPYSDTSISSTLSSIQGCNDYIDFFTDPSQVMPNNCVVNLRNDGPSYVNTIFILLNVDPSLTSVNMVVVYDNGTGYYFSPGLLVFIIALASLIIVIPVFFCYRNGSIMFPNVAPIGSSDQVKTVFSNITRSRNHALGSLIFGWLGLVIGLCAVVYIIPSIIALICWIISFICVMMKEKCGIITWIIFSVCGIIFYIVILAVTPQNTLGSAAGIFYAWAILELLYCIISTYFAFMMLKHLNNAMSQYRIQPTSGINMMPYPPQGQFPFHSNGQQGFAVAQGYPVNPSNMVMATPYNITQQQGMGVGFPSQQGFASNNEVTMKDKTIAF